MKILLLDDNRKRHYWFLTRFNPDNVIVCERAVDAIDMLKLREFDVAFLDHDLLPSHYQTWEECQLGDKSKISKFDNETGYAVAKFLAENPKYNSNTKIYIQSQNEFQAKRMLEVLKKAGRPVRWVPWNRQDLLTSVVGTICSSGTGVANKVK